MIKAKPGGLNSCDQSRSRWRLSLVSRSTFFKCEDYQSGQDQKFFFSVEIFKIETFQLKLWRTKIFVKIVETHQDCQDLLRFVKTHQDLSRNLDIIKIFGSWHDQNFQISTNFLILIETFWTRHWSRSRFLDCRDKIFENVKIFLTVEMNSLTMSTSRLSSI